MQSIFFYWVAFAAILFYGVLPIIAKKVETVIPPFAFIAMTMAVLSLSALTASLIFEKTFQFSTITPQQVWLLLAFGLVNLASFSLFLYSITTIPVAHYQLISALTPIISGILAFLFLGQEIGVRFLIAIPVILTGLYIALVK